MLENNLKKAEMAKLSNEQLEKVTGGVITAQQQSMLNNVLKQAKASGISKEEVLSLVPSYYNALHNQYPNVTLAELQAYINENWDKL